MVAFPFPRGHFSQIEHARALGGKTHRSMGNRPSPWLGPPGVSHKLVCVKPPAVHHQVQSMFSCPSTQLIPANTSAGRFVLVCCHSLYWPVSALLGAVICPMNSFKSKKSCWSLVGSAFYLLGWNGSLQVSYVLDQKSEVCINFYRWKIHDL